jgi:NTE family protein
MSGKAGTVGGPGVPGVLGSLCLALFWLLVQPPDAGCAEGRPSIGLVLAGGGARGFAHIGTLKTLDSLEIPVDYIAGTSMGGIIGGLYAVGYSGAEIERIASELNWEELFTDRPARGYVPYVEKKDDGRFQLGLQLTALFRPVEPAGLIAGQKISLLLSRLTMPAASTDFDSLPVPFRCVAVDLISGREVVLASGSLARAMRATMSIPSVFVPVEWGDSLLVDGGILNNLPADVVRAMGADLVIAVDVGAPKRTRNELKSMTSILRESAGLQAYERVRANRRLCDILVEPALGGLSAADFNSRDVARIVAAGERAVEEVLPRLVALKHRYALDRSECDIPCLGFGDAGVRSLPGEDFTDSRLASVEVRGNSRLSADFILGILDLENMEHLDVDLLEERVNHLYSLGYFQLVTYDLRPAGVGRVHLVVKVVEKRFREIQIGVHYNDYHRLIGRVGLRTSSVGIPGMRSELDFEFAGLTRLRGSVSYPTRTLDFPVYPHLGADLRQEPVIVYQPDGSRYATFDLRSAAATAGLTMSVGSSAILTLDYDLEFVDVEPDILSDPDLGDRFAGNDRLGGLLLGFRYDGLDDVVTPRSGARLSVDVAEMRSDLLSDVSYRQATAVLDFYLTPLSAHSVHLRGFYTWANAGLPQYRFRFSGGPESFVGMDYMQLFGPGYMVGGIGYRYQYRRDVFFKAVLNGARVYDTFDSGLPMLNRLWGGGVGVKFTSIIGSLELTYGRGPRSVFEPARYRDHFYLWAGYEF